jgi:hypothetical protein
VNIRSEKATETHLISQVNYRPRIVHSHGGSLHIINDGQIFPTIAAAGSRQIITKSQPPNNHRGHHMPGPNISEV